MFVRSPKRAAPIDRAARSVERHFECRGAGEIEISCQLHVAKRTRISRHVGQQIPIHARSAGFPLLQRIGQITADRLRADRIAQCVAAVNRCIAPDRASSTEHRAAGDRHRPGASRAIHLQFTGGDGRRSGVGVGTGERERAGPILHHRTRAAQTP